MDVENMQSRRLLCERITSQCSFNCLLLLECIDIWLWNMLF